MRGGCETRVSGIGLQGRGWKKEGWGWGNDAGLAQSIPPTRHRHSTRRRIRHTHQPHPYRVHVPGGCSFPLAKQEQSNNWSSAVKEKDRQDPAPD